MTPLFSRVFRRLRPHLGRTAGGVVLVLATSLAELAKPWPLKLIVDQVLGGEPLPAIGFPDQISSDALLAACAVGLVGLFFVVGALSLASDRLTIDVGQRMVGELRRDLFGHLERLSIRRHDRRSTGDLVYRLAADTMALQTLAMNAVFPTLSAVLFLLGMVGVMLSMNVQLTLLALAVTPFIALSVRMLGRRIETRAATAKAREADLYAVAETSLSAIRLTKAFRAEAVEERRIDGASREALDRHLSLYTTQSGYSLVVSVLGAVGTAVVLWFGARLVLAGALTVGDLLVFAAYLASFYAPISTLSDTFGLAQEARAGLTRVFELLDLPREADEGTRERKPGDTPGAISVEGVEYAYEPGRPVLQGVSLEVRLGEKLALVGPSGSGKTTLAMLMLRFLEPDAGFLRLDGTELRELPLRSLRGAFSTVLQPPLVLPGTVAENVAYGRPDATRDEIEEAVRVAQLEDVVLALPHGLDTPLEVAGARLSQGERQRLTVARAVLAGGPIWLLDEPTASLDAVTEARLLGALEQARGERTCILIAHGTAALAWADRIAVLREGRIVAIGTAEELAGRVELGEPLPSTGATENP